MQKHAEKILVLIILLSICFMVVINILAIKPITKEEKPVVAVTVTNDLKATVLITNNDLNLFERLVEAETSDDTNYDNKLGVATVVMNRVDSEDFPNTVLEVIYEKGQFSPITDGHINNTPSIESKKAVRDVLNGYRSFGKEVLYFCDREISPNNWVTRNCVFVVKLGKHSFFKDKS